jgi:hypothetical protein
MNGAMGVILKLIIRTIVDILVWGVFFTALPFLFFVIWETLKKELVKVSQQTQNEVDDES